MVNAMNDRYLAIEAWESLFRAQHEVFADISGDFGHPGLAQDEYDVLLNVTRADEQTARLRDVTANMLISQPSVSRLVDRMVLRGLVTKSADPCDGRGTLLTATPFGAELFLQVASKHGVSITRRMAVLDDQELETLLALTTKLRTRPVT